MPPKELIEYIQYELQRGTPQEKIVSDLLSARWSQEQINAAFAALGLQTTHHKKKDSWFLTSNKGVLKWTVLIPLSLVPIFVPIYFVGLIVISIMRKDFKIFLEGFFQMILALLVLAVVGFGVCLYIFSQF